MVAAPTIIAGNYIAGKRAALRHVDAEPFEDETAQHLLEELADKMDVPTPKLMIGRMGTPNAFAVGRKGSGVIVVSAVLVQHLTEEELEAVLAHELSHLKSHDTVLMTMGNSLVLMIDDATRGLTRNRSGMLDTVIGAVFHIIGKVVKMLLMLPLRSISRYREYVADTDSAHFTENPRALKTALIKIGRYHRRSDTPSTPEDINELCIFSADKGLVDRVLGTHPPLDARIERLDKMPSDGPEEDT